MNSELCPKCGNYEHSMGVPCQRPAAGDPMTACGLCGHRSHAGLGGRADGVDLCHGCVYGGLVPCPNNYHQPRSCYERWTVYGERPDLEATP